ncbi:MULTISPECIES: translation elongation factor Ts [Gammaproteobacteria]|uniref:Elongation factor Ts n=5 Tax=Bacteria TaxID=2 RepID=T0QRJ0_AERSA|nr:MULTISPECIES: translation elongation factor Ts [Gammaproteobacteria]ELI6432484.1 elongation factor Ts [Aeromonas salmonicida subsp. salmonicida]ATP08541.1 translation elongation factor Ts [Aeromonas salmonicida subsp. pectinolytica 34mel]ATU96969.1 elongation factor Ts [Aeromonas salmonicida]EQC04164.1 elongation factor Ts [Aeromonas salmonicida subsp. pectinolytica 34mel]MBS2783317.1 elongation factor Ts [Aeromonas salmonicida]
MANVTAALVKELRERTAAGMMDCKKALEEAAGDIELAIENMRKSGQAKAAKKAGRIAAEGVIFARTEGNVAVMIELNSETDFVAKDASFMAMGQKIADIAATQKIADVDALKAADFGNGESVELTITNLIAKIGENMNLRRVMLVEGDNLGTYVHGSRIGVITKLTGGTAELAKDLAMHVAANSPQFVKPEDVSAEVVAKEREIQIDIAINSGKPKEIAEKMVEGRMKKFTGEVSLTGQPFVKDPSMTVAELLKKEGADVVSFTRFEVGEGIEKQETDFAAEVAAQIAAAQKA